MGCVTIPSLSIVAFLFLQKSEAYVEQIAQDRLVNLRNSRSQTLLNFLDSSANIISQFANTQPSVNGFIDLKDGLPSAADAVLESIGEKSSLLKKANSKVNGYYRGAYLKQYESYNPGSDALLQFIPSEMDGVLLQDAFIASNPNSIKNRFELLDSSIVPTYSVFHEKYHPKILEFIQKHQYYDALLIDADSSKIVYSTMKEADFGLNIQRSALKNTALSRVFDRAKKIKSGETVFEDFSLYTPSLGQPIAFWGSPIFLDGRLVGVLVIKIKSNLISNVISNYYSWEEDGLGKTGDVIVTGADGMLRSDSRDSIQNPEVFLRKLLKEGRKKEYQMYLLTHSDALLEKNNSLAFQEGVNGQVSTASYKSLDDKDVIGSFRPLRFQEINWVISAEMDRVETQNLSSELKKYIWISVFVIGLLLIPISYLVAQFFLKPFSRLIDTIDRIYNTGNLKLRLRGRFTTEVNSLIRSFNRMLEQLQENEDTITAAKESIDDSISVANRVLVSKLPSQSEFDEFFSQSTVLWRPRDVVGGDIYWLRDFGNRIYLACIDCTGHGVPGAFIAMTAISSLEKIPSTTYEWYELPQVIEAIHQSFQLEFIDVNDSNKFKDGFAISILCLDKYAKSISFIGMGQDGMIKHADESVTFIKGNRKSIGYKSHLDVDSLQSFSQPWSDEDTYVLYSDGLTTQVGDRQRKMMGTHRLINSLEQLSGNDPQKVVEQLAMSFDMWRGAVDARDDLTIIAIKPKP
jgi:serine phosphatase RsbU (regulator of sigma subunit)